jgi:hypothetical protein
MNMMKGGGKTIASISGIKMPTKTSKPRKKKILLKISKMSR